MPACLDISTIAIERKETLSNGDLYLYLTEEEAERTFFRISPGGFVLFEGKSWMYVIGLGDTETDLSIAHIRPEKMPAGNYSFIVPA